MLLDPIIEMAARQPAALALQTPARTLNRAELVAAIRARASDLGPTRPGAIVPVPATEPGAAFIDMLAARAAGGVPLLIGPHDGMGMVSSEVSLPDGAAWLSATGGTTGAARLIAFSDAQTAAAAGAHARVTGLRSGATLVVTVPPWTSYGRNCWLGALLAGASVRFVTATAPRDLLRALAGEGVAWGCTTPPVVRALARLPATAAATSGRAPLMSSAAAYPAAEAAVVAERHGVMVLERYGCTEVGPIALAREPGGPLWPVPGVALGLGGSPPTLEVTGASVALGIAGGREFEGVFRTADAVDFADDGSFRIIGRVDRVVKRMARVVDLAALERVVAAQDGVAHARVQAMPGALDVDLVAQVVPRAGYLLEARVVAARLAELLPPWERPTRVEVVADATLDVTKWSAAP